MAVKKKGAFESIDKSRFTEELLGLPEHVETEERELEPGEFERAVAVVRAEYARRRRAEAAEFTPAALAQRLIEEAREAARERLEVPREFPETEDTTDELEG